MKYFKEIFQKIASIILIHPAESETEKAKKIIWYSFFASIALLFVISSVIFILFTSYKESIKVPMINGDNIYIALKKLYEKKLVSNVTPKYSDEKEVGVVYKQNPKQGSIVKRGRAVAFNVSLGTKKMSLPDFTGFTLFELEEYLDNEYPGIEIPFDIENPVYKFNENVEKGRIFLQEPKSGIPVYNIKKIKFWISNGLKDEGAKIIKNYIDRNIEEVSKELAKLEILYTYKFEIVKNKSLDMLVIDQSIAEGRLVDELIEEGKNIVLTVNKYKYRSGKKIKGTYLLDLPKKPIPYLLEVKIKNDNIKERTILKIKTKGGLAMPVLYTAEENSELSVYCDGKLINKIKLLMDDSATIK